MFAWALLLALPWDVEWDVPAGCPSQEEFVAMVEAEARTQAETEAPAVLTADVRIERRSARRWQLMLRLAHCDAVDTRVFDGDSCAAVVEAAALIVSLRLVEWVTPEPGPEPEPSKPLALEPQPPLPMATEEAPMPAPAPAPAAPPSFERVFAVGGWLGVHGGLALGVAPGIGGALGLDGGLTGRGWRAGVAVQAMPRRNTPHPNSSAVVGRFDLVQAELFGCGSPSVGRSSSRSAGGWPAGGCEGRARATSPAPSPRGDLGGGSGDRPASRGT